MNRLALGVSLAAALIATAATAADIGIPACDDFLAKYEVCVSGKIPAAQQATFKAQLDQLRASWTTLAQNPNTRPTLEAACKQTADQMKAAMTPYGCSF
ncbi:MAG TPA: hypothetical protein VKT73_10885 [Xanthobacteraceae bacterium]|nr:hypothetical protein [Xanthobacteraceae bacterium]